MNLQCVHLCPLSWWFVGECPNSPVSKGYFGNSTTLRGEPVLYGIFNLQRAVPLVSGESDFPDLPTALPPTTSIHSQGQDQIPLSVRSLRRKYDVFTGAKGGKFGHVRLALIKGLTRQNGVRSRLRAFDLSPGVAGCRQTDLGPAWRTSGRQALSRVDLGGSARSSSKIMSRLS